MKMINDKIMENIEKKILKCTHKGVTIEFTYVKYFNKWYYACKTKFPGWYILKEDKLCNKFI